MICMVCMQSKLLHHSHIVKLHVPWHADQWRALKDLWTDVFQNDDAPASAWSLKRAVYDTGAVRHRLFTECNGQYTDQVNKLTCS